MAGGVLGALFVIFEALPVLDALGVLLVYGLVPISLFLLCSRYTQLSLTKRRSLSPSRSSSASASRRKPVKLHYAMGYLVHRHAGKIALLGLLWALIVALAQSVYVYHHLTVGTDISYYMQVNLAEYEGVNNIQDAQNLNSLNVVLVDFDKVGESRRSTRIGDESMSRNTQSDAETGMSLHSSTAKTLKEMFGHKRSTSSSQNKLQSSQSQTLSIVYHSKNWDNMLTEQNLINICLTEQKMIAEMSCLNIWHYKSMIPTIFDLSTCEYFVPFQDILYKFGLSENEAYVEDGISSNYPRSDILISFFKTGTCGDYSENSLVSMFDDVEIENVEITYVSEDFVQTEFNAAIMDAVYYSIITIIFCAAFMFLGVRGIIITVLTFFSIIISIVHASAMLPYWDYGSFSAFNVLSIFILIGVGANAVLIFGASWRRIVKQPAHKKATPSNLIHAYDNVSKSVLFTTAAACISLFSKLCSPVIVISQLGAFMGISVFVFYIMFHFVIIPAWIYTSRWTWPKLLHEQMDRLKKKICCCCRSRDQSSRNSEMLNDSFVAMETSNSRGNALPPSEPSAPAIDTISYTPLSPPVDNEFTMTYPAQPSMGRQSIGEESSSRYSRWCNVLTCSGFVSLLCTLFALLLVYHFVEKNLKVDFGIPQLFDPDSNIGQSMYIVKYYKSDIFTIHDNSIDASPTASPVFAVPSFKPTSAAPSISFRPTVAPTLTGMPSFSRNPTAIPTFSAKPTISMNPTALPTISMAPTTFHLPTKLPTVGPTLLPTVCPTSSTIRPTIRPSTSEMPTVKDKKHVDYSVSGCWGIYSTKKHIDSDPVLSFKSNVFKQYSQGTAKNGVFYNSGLLSDMKSMCDYIQANRDSLDVSPDWIKERDCIYDQFMLASQSNFWKSPNAPPFTVGNVLIYWGTLDYTSGSLLGVETNTNHTDMLPIWLCFNVSARTEGVTSLISDAELAVKLSDKWISAFNNHGSSYAKSYDFPIIIGSTEFSFPILASEVLFSIELSTIISVSGFVFLLIMFTKGDLGLTVLGTLAMITIVAVSVCVHEYTFVGDFDLLDVVVLIAVMGMAVDFPIHFLMEFVHTRDKKVPPRKQRVSQPSPPIVPPPSTSAREPVEQSVVASNNQRSGMNPEYIHIQEDNDIDGGPSWLLADQLVSAVQDVRHRRNSTATVVDTTTEPRRRSISPALARTHKYLLVALIPPMILTILAGLPLLRADFQLLRKCGQYIIILAVVSYVFCIIFLPYYMPLGYRPNCCRKKKASEVVEADDDFERSPSDEYLDLETERNEERDDSRRSNLTDPLLVIHDQIPEDFDYPPVAVAVTYTYTEVVHVDE